MLRSGKRVKVVSSNGSKSKPSTPTLTPFEWSGVLSPFVHFFFTPDRGAGSEQKKIKKNKKGERQDNRTHQ